MERRDGWLNTIALAMAGKRSPWGKPGNDGGDSGGDGGDTPPSGEDTPAPKGPRNPWLPGGGSGSGETPPRRSASIEDIFRNRGPEGPRRRMGGPGGPNFRIPQRPGGGSWLPFIAAALVGGVFLYLSTHQIGPKEQAVVTTFGKYSQTLQPGLYFKVWPLQVVDREQVSEFRVETIPEGEGQRLMLTGDQNLVDLSYNVRWNIKDLRQFRFQLLSPEDTVREVAEAAMRAEVAEKTLDEVFSGAGRAEVELRVRERIQGLLDAYRSGIAVQGVQIRKSDPPSEVEDAFKNVSVAQQEAESYLNQAEAAAQQVLARAQGDATAFDKVYEQYRLAPEVTRRRMYYETMERVLRQTDKTIIEGGGGVTPYLPLPEVRRRAAEQPATTGAQ